MRKFNEVLKGLREERHLSQRALAEKLGISNSAVGMYESGNREPNYDILEQIADFFNVDMNYLLGKTTIKNSYINKNSLQYDRHIVSIHMENIIKCQLADGQISDDPKYIIEYLKEILDNRLNEDDRYTTNHLYVKFYDWLTGNDDISDVEVTCLNKALTNDGSYNYLEDDEIFYDILNEDMSLNRIISMESEDESKYSMALKYERDLKIELLKDKYTVEEKEILNKKLNALQCIISEFNSEYDFLDQYDNFVAEIKNQAEKYRFKFKIIEPEIFDKFELEHIKKYRTLDKYGKDLVDTVLQKEYERRTEHAKEFIMLQPPLLVPYYGHVASAGTGQYVFDDIPPEMIEIENEMDNMQVDFAIGVNGDSMEPTYRDGDTLLIKKQSEIHIGEVGIFMINGEAFVKELGDGVLISHNKKYKDIHINDSVICLGKVISKHIS